LDHPLVYTEYNNVIINAIAVIGIKEDRGWMDAEDYTPKYSVFIKITHMLVIRLAYMQREDAIADVIRKSKRRVDKKIARQKVKAIFDIIRRKM
jgi:hypothetical protein